jgi:2-polyprenyl-6-methoxyphenol hydroxylase-like FAD-dependent oxidoreductase
LPGKVEDALKVVEGWDPMCRAIISSTPENRIVDWKLVFRDPLPNWLSPKARIALIGDAAHPFLPTSIQGAAQSMEDGVTIAACLDIAGKEKVQEALRVFEKIRYPRVLKAQRMGVTTRDQWHKMDFETVHANPSSVLLSRPQWLLAFDAAAHAYNVYQDILDQIQADSQAQIKAQF